MKRLPVYLSAFFLLIVLAGHAATLYVSPLGSDLNNGSKEKPFATLAKALRAARELRRINDPSVAGGIRIILQGGLYPLNEPVFIRPEDSGTPADPTIIEAAPGEQPVLSGGIAITGWKKLVLPLAGLPAISKNKVWVADVPMVNGNLFEFRQLWINELKAVRAKSVNGNKMDRILGWNKTEQTCWIPTLKISSLQNRQSMEMFIHQWWSIAILR